MTGEEFIFKKGISGFETEYINAIPINREVIADWLDEFAAEKDKEIEQLKTQLEMEQLEKEIYYNRLAAKEGTNAQQVYGYWEQIKTLDKKLNELKNKGNYILI